MIIKNGTVVTASDTVKADILIKNGKIVNIANKIDVTGNEQVVDAKGMYVIPGGVDAHTHFDLDVGIARTADNFETGSIAAACGGTTSVVDHMAFGSAGCSLDHMVKEYHKLADGKTVIDYGLHGVIQHVNDEVLADMKNLIKDGITSYKFYLAYDNKLNDTDTYKVIERGQALGLMLTVHPENGEVVDYLRAKFVKEGKLAAKYHPLSRPEEVEAESINKVVQMSRVAGDAPMYIVHLSSDLALSVVNAAKGRGQKNLYVETCPQYLFLDDSKYDLPNNEGLKYIMSPPLRDKRNNELLWRGIVNNEVDTIATDHCSFNFKEQKMMGKDNFTACPNGGPGVETRIPLIFSEGVSKGRISVNKFVDICCTRPAKLFGLYPGKGTIAVGSDADIVIIDPNKKVKLTKSILHENLDYTPYEGIDIVGYPVMTISRGDIIAKDGKYVGDKGRGRYIVRKMPILNP